MAFDGLNSEWKANARAQVNLDLAGTLSPAQGWRAENLTADFPIAAAWDRNAVIVGLTAPATIGASRINGPGNSADMDAVVAKIEADPSIGSFDLSEGLVSFAISSRVEAQHLSFGGERVEPTGVKVRMEFKADESTFQWSAKGNATSIKLPLRSWTTKAAEITASGDKEGVDFQAAIDGLKVTPEVSDADLRIKGRLASGRLDATLTAMAAGPTPREVGRARVTADLGKEQAKADVELGPLTFKPGGLQPAAFAPRLRRALRDVAGTVAVRGSIRWRNGALESDLGLAIEKLSGIAGPITFVNLNGVIDIDRLWPISTAPDQVIAIEQVVSGLPMQAVLLRFELDGLEIDIREGKLDLIGGSATMEPGRFAFTSPGQRLFLKVQGLSLGEFFELAGIDGLSGDGEISGQVPVTLFPNGIIIADAILSSDRPGVLRYDRARAPAALTGAGESMELALSALSDFHYEKLIVRLDRKLTGDAILGLHIAGANPSFYEGYPVELNLTMTGKLDEVVRKGLAGYQLPSIIEQRLNEIKQ
jgi:hypothetical protein